MSRQGAVTRGSASSARSGRPPRETMAPTDSGACAAATSAAPAPVLAPKYPSRRPAVSGLAGQPAGGSLQPLGQERDVEDLGAVVGLFVFKKIDQQRCQAGVLQAPARRTGSAGSAARCRCRVRTG